MYNGSLLAAMLSAPVAPLEQARDEINAINAFPVPDGDSGTNMLYTWRAVAASVDPSEEHTGKVATKAARAALLSARGNSGIILSQMLAGFSKELKEKPSFTVGDFASALKSARDAAYKSVTEPVEGTVLTVMDAAARAALAAAPKEPTLDQLLLTSAKAAREALARTTEQLAVLKERGVVDSGGLGLCIILESWRDAAEHTLILTPQVAEEVRGVRVKQGSSCEAPAVSRDAHYGVEVQFTLEGESLDAEGLRERLRNLGDSLLVVGDEQFLKVHIHTRRPQDVLDLVLPLGDLDQLTFEDLDAQARSFAQDG